MTAFSAWRFSRVWLCSAVPLILSKHKWPKPQIFLIACNFPSLDLGCFEAPVNESCEKICSSITPMQCICNSKLSVCNAVLMQILANWPTWIPQVCACVPRILAYFIPPLEYTSVYAFLFHPLWCLVCLDFPFFFCTALGVSRDMWALILGMSQMRIPRLGIDPSSNIINSESSSSCLAARKTPTDKWLNVNEKFPHQTYFTVQRCVSEGKLALHFFSPSLLMFLANVS